MVTLYTKHWCFCCFTFDFVVYSTQGGYTIGFVYSTRGGDVLAWFMRLMFPWRG